MSVRRENVEVENKILIKMKTFHNLKYKANPHEKLNTLNRFIRNRDLSLATSEKIKTALGEQGVTDYKRVTIRRGGKEI